MRSIGLIHDTHPDVRIAALNAFGLFFREKMKPEKAKGFRYGAERYRSSGCDYGGLGRGADRSCFWRIAHWPAGSIDSLPENRRIAAAALSANGKSGRNPLDPDA